MWGRSLSTTHHLASSGGSPGEPTTWARSPPSSPWPSSPCPLCLGEPQSWKLSEDVLEVASHHVSLEELHVCLASHADLPGNESDDGHGLRHLLAIPVEDRHRAKGGVGLVLRPLTEAKAEVLEIDVASMEEQADEFTTTFQVKVGELDHRHLDVSVSVLDLDWEDLHSGFPYNGSASQVARYVLNHLTHNSPTPSIGKV